MGLMYPRIHGLLSNSAVDLSSGLLHLWEFENNSNLGEDSIGSLDFTNVNGVTQTTGKVGFASEADAASSQNFTQPFDTAQFDLNMSEYTFAFWFNYRDAIPPGGQVNSFFRILDTNTNIPLFYVELRDNDRLRVQWVQDNFVSTYRRTIVDYSTNYPFNNWHHYVIKKESSGAGRVFINGAEVGNQAGTNPTVPSVTQNATTAFRIFLGVIVYIDAYCDQFAIWNKSLNQEEINALYNNGHGVSLL